MMIQTTTDKNIRQIAEPLINSHWRIMSRKKNGNDLIIDSESDNIGKAYSFFYKLRVFGMAKMQQDVI